MAIDPRIRDTAGQFSSKNTFTGKALLKAWAVLPRRRPALPTTVPTPSLSFDRGTQLKGILLEFDAVPSAFSADKIDEVNAIIRGVSVITSGLIARGHDLEVDDVTLDQMQKCAESKGQVPVKVDHKSGAAAVCGFLTNFRREEGKLKADWHLLESHPQKAQILEVARRMPRGVGLSASFVSPDKPERTKSGKPAARCEELISVDYVTLPAANPDGMFAAKVDSPSSPMNPELLAAIQAAIKEAVAPLSEQLNALQKRAEIQDNPPTLEEVANMTEAELAELGLTPADVQEALEAIAAEDASAAEPTATTPEAAATTPAATAGTAPAVATSAPGTSAAPAAPVGSATGFEALGKQLKDLSSEVAALKGQKVIDAEAKLVTELEHQFEALVQENTRLVQALKAGGPAVTPGVDRNGITFFSAKKNEGRYEKLVQFGIEEKKLSKGRAFEFARNEDPSAYRDYLVRLGVYKATE